MGRVYVGEKGDKWTGSETASLYSLIGIASGTAVNKNPRAGEEKFENIV